MTIYGITSAGPTAPARSKEPPSKKDLKTERLWEKYGWTGAQPSRDLTSLLTKYPDCAHFLRKSGLLFMIRGYQHTLDRSHESTDPGIEEMQDGIKLDPYDGHPLLFVEGDWTRWEDLSTWITYDSKKKKIVSSDNPAEEWNYCAPDGLCRIGRYNEIYPIYHLSESDQAALQKQGEKFFQGNVPEKLQNDRKRWHYLQVFTSENGPISKLSHVGLRLIDANGAVYSLGFETSDEIPFKEQYFVGSYDVGITSLDYDEFKPFNARRVTTIPLTGDQYRNAMKQIEAYSKGPMRFNRMHQNCSTYATSVMRAAGHPMDVRSTLPELIVDLVPDLPVCSKIARAIGGFFKWIFPSCICHLLGAIAIKISTVCTNLIAYCFGSTQGSPPHPKAENGGIENQDKMNYFDRLVESPEDLLSEEAAIIYSPAKVVNWQLAQPSTVIYPNDGSPQLTIIPPKAT